MISDILILSRVVRKIRRKKNEILYDMNDRNTVLEIAKKCLKSTTKNKKEEIKNIGEMRI